jgi:hypothetical protein
MELRKEALMDLPKDPMTGFHLEQKKLSVGRTPLSTELRKEALMDHLKDLLTWFQLEPRKLRAGLTPLSTGLRKEALMDLLKDSQKAPTKAHWMV